MSSYSTLAVDDVSFGAKSDYEAIGEYPGSRKVTSHVHKVILPSISQLYTCNTVYTERKIECASHSLD